MHANGSTQSSSDSTITPQEKKPPPKPPKRVSFNLKRQIIQQPSSSPNLTTAVIINGSPDSIEHANIQQCSINKLSASSDETSDKQCDKAASSAKVNTSICDIGQSNIDNEVRGKNLDNAALKTTIIEQRKSTTLTANERLKLEFVKTTNTSSKLTAFSWSNRRAELQIVKDIKSPALPNSNLQTRLSESQSKIAKLQQSLPTKLSDATVESLKNKYSPASFGYPKTFIRSSSDTSKIPSPPTRSFNIPVLKTFKKKAESLIQEANNGISNKDAVQTEAISSDKNNSVIINKEEPNILTSLQSTESKLLDRANTSEIEILDSSVKEQTDLLISSVNKRTNLTAASPKRETSILVSSAPVEAKKTYRTEIVIFPSETAVILGREINNNEKILEKLQNPDTEVKLEEIQDEIEVKVPIVEAKFISSEIFPKDPIKVEDRKGKNSPKEQNNNKVTLADENISRTQELVEQSSDTLTESEDSENSQNRSVLSNSTLTEVGGSNLTLVDENSDNLSELVCAEACEEIEMEDSKKKSSKKRSNSFRRIFSFGSSKDKKKNEESSKATKANGIKKKDNAASDNAHNEAHVFDRNAPQRHTVSGHYNTKAWDSRTTDNVASDPFYSNTSDRFENENIQQPYSYNYYENHMQCNLPVPPTLQICPAKEIPSNKIDDRLNKMQFDLHVAQQTNKELNSNLVSSSENTLDEYVCMENTEKTNRTDLTQPGFINAHSIDKYIDTTSSSSISTLESDTRNNIYENSIQSSRPSKIQNVNTKIPLPSTVTSDRNHMKETGSGEKCYERPKFADSPEIFTTTPRRAQGPQLIKPKAIIPLNTERPLPIPYGNIKEKQQPDNINRENLYGNISNLESIESNLNDMTKQFSPKATIYGKPIPALRRNISVNESTYGNVSSGGYLKENAETLVPVGAQLKITRPVEINGNKSFDKLRSRSVSPSQRHRATNVKSPVLKTRPAVPASPSSPSRKELEATKLKLPVNREKAEPRLKSPVDERRSQTKKVLEPNKKDDKVNISTHQNLEIEIDYPDNNMNEAQDRKETPEKLVFSVDKLREPTSPKKTVNLKRSTPVSPNRPKSFTHSTPKSHNDRSSTPSEIPGITSLRSPILIRTESPISLTSSHSVSSLSPRSKLPVTNEDLKDLKNTEVYFWEQTNRGESNLSKKEDTSPEQSPQQVLTQATVHHTKPPTGSQKSSVPMQKIQNLQNVEAYYWQQIKKLKEKEEHELYNQHLQMMARQYAMNQSGLPSQHRSRSLSAGGARQGERRSVSLPRDALPPSSNQRLSSDVYGYTRTGRQACIPEGRAINSRIPRERMPQALDYAIVRQSNNFIRGSPQRSTVGPISTQKEPAAEHLDPTIYENYFPGVELRHQAKIVDSNSGYAPIFKRGSLVTGPVTQQDSPPQSNKKVSFSSAQTDNVQVWPTKNGFTQSPPTRRVDKKPDNLDDEVFLPNPTTTNVQYNIQQPDNRTQIAIEPVYTSNKPPPNQTREPIYGTKSVQKESMYVPKSNQPAQSWPKQVTVTNKVCDMYGQIHETAAKSPPQSYGNIQKTGVIYGQLQPNPVPGSPMSLRNQCLNRSDPCFVRATRLTASFGDMRRDVSMEAPRRPLPPIPGPDSPMRKVYGRLHVPVSESESGSEAGEVMRILQRKERPRGFIEEEWNSDSKSGRSQSGTESGVGGARGVVDNEGEVRGSRSRSGRRDDPRRHTLSGADQHYPAGMAAQQGGSLARTMDLEVPMPRGYPPPSSAMLFDDDPGIMSEVETSSTGFRRGGKQRSSLPVVRTPSKTLERPLGLVFLQYRNETKRALLPNEITSIDTVKALFVRSFPKQLTMEYLDSPLVKIYIHDSSKDMFYELEDLRSHLRDIRDRSVLRLFESADISGGLPGPGTGISGGIGHFEDQSYFSEPEFDSEYQHQHIHKSKTSGAKGAPPYYMGSTTMPRGGPLLRAYSPAIGGPIPADRLKSLPAGAPPKPVRTYAAGDRGAAPLARPAQRFNTFHSQAELRHRADNPLFSMSDRMHSDGYMSSPERSSRVQYEDPYYSQYAARSGSITPVIDEEASDTELLDESYSLYGVKLAPAGGPRAVPAPRTQFPPAPTAVPYDATRIRVENMERQLANLTGLVQKALHQNPVATREFLQVPTGRDSYRSGDEFDKNSSSSSASLPDKSVSFEKSVSFSDEPPDMNSPKQHSPQHAADTKPPKPAIKSSTLPRTSSQERDRLKPAPPPKPASLSPAQYDNSRHIYRDLQLTPEMYNQLRGLQKKAKDLRTEVRNLRRLSQAQAHSVRETIRDTFIKIRAMLLASGEQVWQAGIDQEKLRLSREEDLYKQEMLRLEKDLTELEATVEELRGNVINRKTRVNMSDVENMALILSKSSKTVADLKLRFPGLQDAMKNLLSSEMEKVVREEKFLKEEPERLENALRRCKKLTGTLVTLKRLASVQEQRLPCANNTGDGRLSPSLTETPPITPPSAQHSKPPAVPTTRTVLGQSNVGGDTAGGGPGDSGQRPENALDALLDELQTFSKPHPTPSTVTTQLPQGATSYTTKGAGGATPSMAEIGRKGSMDSATLLPVQNLTVSTATGSLRRLHSYPSGSDTDNSPPIQPLQRGTQLTSAASKPPIPERNAELLQHLASGRRVPPPPPPRTSSKSPLASPTSPSLPPRSVPNALQHIQNVQSMSTATDKPQSQFEAATQNLGLSTLRRNVPGRSSLKEKAQTLPRNIGSNLQPPQTNPDGDNKPNPMSASNSSSCESVNSQEGAKKSGSRKEELEQRHQELLKKQKALQEQYARLQQLQRGNNTLTVVPPAPDLLLKKTGSESNLLQKMGLQMTAPQQVTGSLTHLANTSLSTAVGGAQQTVTSSEGTSVSSTTTSKVYETDIL